MREIIAPLSQMLKSGEISSVELTNKYINAIENDNPKYNAYVSTTFEKALENAKFADKLIAESKSSALTGIPMTLKDNICSDGDLTTCCSKILEGFVLIMIQPNGLSLKRRAQLCLAKQIWTNLPWVQRVKQVFTALR